MNLRQRKARIRAVTLLIAAASPDEHHPLERELRELQSHPRCVACARYFLRYRCSARTHGECDCPKCQGYCRCKS